MIAMLQQTLQNTKTDTPTGTILYRNAKYGPLL